MPFGVPDTRQFPWDQALSNNLQQLTNKVTGGINTWAVNPTVGVDGLALGINHVGYTGVNTTNSSLDRWNGSTWNTLLDGTKIVNTPQLIVYVSQAAGDDSNDGLTSSTAWATTSKLYQELAKYNFLGKQVIVNLGAGTYNLEFPGTTSGNSIIVKGVSSSTVIIQNMLVNKGQSVWITGVTLGYATLPDTANWMVVQADRGSTILLGGDVILGPIGTYIAGAGRWHFYASNASSVNMFANSPVTVTGSVNTLILADTSTIAFWNNSAIGNESVLVYPNRAPLVNKGVVNTSPIARMTAADTVAFLNFTGSRVVDQVFNLRNDSSINGNGNWKASVTGSVTGKAYQLASSSIYGSTFITTPSSQGIAYPATISAGTKDTASVITMGTGI